MDALAADGFVADMVLCDPPYGTTACKWDSVIPFDEMWRRVWAVSGKNSAVVLTAAQPFTSALVASRIASLKHHWVWVKECGTGFQVAKFRPMMQTEDVLVFTERGLRARYYPVMEQRDRPLRYRSATSHSGSNPLHTIGDVQYVSTHKYPKNVLRFNRDRDRLHPTQKPVALFSYLIQTYTNPGETVLDFCAGSGTTAVAAQSTGRRWVCIEKEQKYCDLLVSRLEGLKCESTLPSRTTTKARKSGRRDSTQSTLPLAV